MLYLIATRHQQAQQKSRKMLIPGAQLHEITLKKIAFLFSQESQNTSTYHMTTIPAHHFGKQVINYIVYILKGLHLQEVAFLSKIRTSGL